MNNKVYRFILIGFFVVLFAGCAPKTETLAYEPYRTATPTALPLSTYTPYPTYTSYPTHTAMPTYTPQPTLIVTYTYTPTPYIFLSIEGKGSIVTDNYSWTRCGKAVFAWKDEGYGRITIRIYKAGEDNPINILNNELLPNTGETVESIGTGTYYFAIRGSLVGWSLIGECRD